MTKIRKSRLGRILMWILLTPLVVCLLGGALSYLINRSLPAQSAQVETLSTLAIAQAQEAMNLMAEAGEIVWPGFSEAHIPLMIYNERYAFLCGAEQAPPSWETLPGQPCFRGVYPNPQAFTHLLDGQWVGSMATQEYMAIKLREDLQEILPRPLAATFPYGLVTSILGTDRYIGALVHEAFHAYQAQTAPERFKDVEMAYASGDAYWQNDLTARADWKLETTALFNALNAQTESEARLYAMEFLKIRSDRRVHSLSDQSLVLYEKRYEWLEGLAKYVELQIQKSAVNFPSHVPQPALLEDDNFHYYSEFDSFWRSELAQMKRQATLEGDTRFYYTGMAQAFLLDRLMPGWKERIFGQGAWLEDLLAEAVR